MTEAVRSGQNEADGASLSKSVDDMLLATGSTEVEAGLMSSHTTGLETLLSQVRAWAVCMLFGTRIACMYMHLHTLYIALHSSRST